MGVVELIMIFCVPEEVPRGNDAPLRPLMVMDDLPLLNIALAATVTVRQFKSQGYGLS